MKATIGARIIMVAKLSEGGNYSDGKIIGKLMTVSQSAEIAEATLYADDHLVDSISEFKKGSMTIGTAGISDEDHAMLLGHKYTKTEGMILNANDNPPFVGVGYYTKAKDVNVSPAETVFVAKWYPKVKFKEPNDDAATKGESVDYKTPTIEGTVFALENGDWKKQKVFSDDKKALAWLEARANISDNSDNGEVVT